MRRARAWAATAAVVVVAAVASGCAARGRAPSGAAAGSAPDADAAPLRNPAAGTVQVTRIQGAGRTFEIASTADAPVIDEQPVAADADRTFGTLVEVYEGRGLKINLVQSDERTIGVRELRVSHHLGRTPLSRYVDCGRDALSGPVADSYIVSLTAVTRVRPTAPGHSTLLTQLVATARAANTAGNPLRCSTTGRLERELNTTAALAAMK